MGINDDSDVKIFKKQQGQNDNDDILSLAEEMNRHRQNGNLQKAKDLGVKLANSTPDCCKADSTLDSSFSAPDKQVCALLLFTTEAALHFYLASPQLSTIAVNTFQDALLDNNYDYYTDVLNNSAFSVYYLILRKGSSDIPKEIGEYFAKLCGQKDNEKYCLIGRNIYNNTLKSIEETIAKIDFID